MNTIKKIFEKYNTFEIEKIISEEEITSKCKEAAEWINKNYQGKHPILIGILKGAAPFLCEIVKHVDIPCHIDFLMAKSYFYEKKSFGSVKIYKDVDFDLKERDVIIIEDIIDSGNTLKELKRIFMARSCKSVKAMTLIEKSSKKINVNANFVGFKIGGEFLVGFGLDYAEMYRHLPYIAKVKFK